MEGDRPGKIELAHPVHVKRLMDDERFLTAVYTEYPVVNNHGQCQKVEHVCEVCPDMRIAVLPKAFSIESVRLGDSCEKSA